MRSKTCLGAALAAVFIALATTLASAAAEPSNDACSLVTQCPGERRSRRLDGLWFARDSNVLEDMHLEPVGKLWERSQGPHPLHPVGGPVRGWETDAGADEDHGEG